MSVKFKETVQTQTNGGGGRSFFDQAQSQAQNFTSGQGFSSGQGFQSGQGFSSGQGFGAGSNQQGFSSGRTQQFSSSQTFSGGQGQGQDHHRHGLIHDAAKYLTRGEGKGGYLTAYISQLQKYPLRTKMLTSGGLAGLQELLASYIAQDRSRNGHYFSSRIPKMMIYGAFISAPMGHLLIKMLQGVFANRTSLFSKVLQILVSNLVVSPIQNSIYLISMAIIAGARTFHQIRATVRAGFMPVMKVSWITSPLALAFAQAFLPPEMWVPFFNFVAFVIGTYVNTITKKKRLAALRKKRYEDGRESSSRTEIRTEEYSSSRRDY